MRGSNYSSSLSFLLRTIVLLLFSVSNFVSNSASLMPDLCHPDERDVLLQLKTEFKIVKPYHFYDRYGYLITSYPKTESWGNSSADCCNWDGVTCDIKSGKVIGLDLKLSCLYGRLESNSSIFRLKHLTSLNLAYNNFTLSPIPAKFNNLILLETLNLSQSSLEGLIPREILQLTNLVSLDLSSSDSPSLMLSIENPPLFLRLLAQNLKNLRALDMSSVNISSEIPHEFSIMRSLRSLNLRSCYLVGEFPSSVFMMPNLQSIILDWNTELRGELPVFQRNNSLQVLRIYGSSFSGIIPESIGNLKHLVSLTLAESNFSGRIPSSLGELSNLSSLRLSGNHFTGEVPSSIGNLKQLISFDVHRNQFTGSFPSALLNLTKLHDIYLSDNQFTGSLPPNIGQLSKLEILSASGNSFTGAVPSSLYQISSLTTIWLGGNQLSDLVGFHNISLLSNLQILSLGSNNFRVSSPLDLNVFSSLKQLVTLDLSGIPVSTSNITSNSDFSSNLEDLYLSGCNITEFPEFIRNLRNLSYLDISRNSIKGQVPYWLWSLQELHNLDLSHNSLSGFDGSLKAVPGSMIFRLDLRSNDFQGEIFIPSTSIIFFLAASNNFTGEIPLSLCGGQFRIIDLSNNNFHDSIPRCLGTHISYLQDLNLRNNSLTGSIPDMFKHAYNLMTIDVSHNRLEGKLPLSLTSCSALQVLNVESNKISDTFPFQLSSLQKLQVLVLRSNNFHGMLYQPDGDWFGFPQLKIIDASHNDFFGTLPSDYFLNWTAISSNEDKDTQAHYIGNPIVYNYYTSLVLMNKGVSMEMERILTVYTAIDFSGNRIHGQVPESIGLLKELHVLNLSRNAFTGHIPPSLANITALESLDLSQNKLSGEIPPTLGDLSSLAWINVSHNQLQGSIPQGTQFQRQKCSSYEGNPGLYGPSLKNICGEPTPPESEVPVSSEEEEAEKESLSWIAAGLGFAPGIVFGFTIGYIIVGYKQEWFTNTFGRNKKHGTR
ncbi:receptor-like protein 6 [Raphanus sativus]|uniref:Receptor-like protein 6 n=1 Tax=Raphanus sativus TaxID=3726 RepID=A0A6J0K4C2_RAPSA|nr:receptor-like protein 6 [Raphanus sativus]